ncbi:unnamed protein product [Effrenium voratum]|uniref:Uncharacterized protein n=1 Tax=Effrenium voratum TaxID=2562239 RepID=A0AA36HPJ2_9DINO|nr:unnamed protein product [Effrenium voratum]
MCARWPSDGRLSEPVAVPSSSSSRSRLVGVVGGDSRSTISSVGVHGCLEHEIRRAGDSRVVSERPVSREELQEKGTLRQADPSELRTARPPASHREFSRPLAEPFTRAPAPRRQEAPPAALAAQGRLGALPGHPGRAGHVGPRGALDLGSRAQLAEVAMVHQCLAKVRAGVSCRSGAKRAIRALAMARKPGTGFPELLLKPLGA